MPKAINESDGFVVAVTKTWELCALAENQTFWVLFTFTTPMDALEDPDFMYNVVSLFLKKALIFRKAILPNPF